MFEFTQRNKSKKDKKNSINVKGVLPREVAQAVEVPTTLEATELGRGMYARSCLGDGPVNLCPYRADLPVACLETGS